MTSTFKSKLLLGAAVTALSFGSVSAAHAVDLAGDSTWGATPPVDAPTAGDTVDLQGFNLTIDNTSSVDTGAITDTGGTPDGNVTVTTSAVADKTQTIASIVTGTGNVAVSNSANDANLAVTVSGVLTSGGTLTVDGSDATSNDVVTLTVGGNTTVTGTTTITGGANAGGNATTTLNLDGASNTFTGAVTVNGGAGAATNTGNLVITGAATAFNGGLVLTDGAAAAAARLTMDGATAQTVSGNITGTGDIIVVNASGATFSGTVGSGTNTILIEQTAADASATFQNTVNVASITLGAAGTDTNTLTFDTTTQGFTVTGTVDGAIAGETNNVVVSGGQTLTQATAWGGVAGQLDNVTVSGSGTTLDSNFAITSGTVTVGSGSTLDAGAIITAATGGIVNNGTLLLSAGVTHAANITGTGLLNVDAGATINGSVTQGSADIAAVTLSQTAASGWNVGTTTFSGNGTLALIGGAQTVAGNFTNVTDGEGTITITDVAGTTAITGNLGASTSNSLAALTIADGGTQANLVTTTGNLFVDTVTIGASDTVQLIGGTQTVSGAVNGGNLTVGSGSSSTNGTFNGVINVAALTVEDSATATFSDTVTTTGNLTVGGATAAGNATFTKSTVVGGASFLDGIVVFGNTNATTPNTFTGAVTVGGNQASTITLASHSDIDGGMTIGASGASFLIKKTATFDPTDADGNGTANEGTDMILDASGTGITRTGTLTIGIATDTLAIEAGSAIQVALDDGTGAWATGIRDGSIVLQDTALLDIQDNASTATALNIVVVSKSVTDVIGTSAVGASAAETLLAIPNASLSDQLLTVKGALQGASTAEEAAEIANSLAPSVDAGAVVGAMAVAGTTANITNTQLASLRDNTETGMFAGNISRGLRAWGQVFGQKGDQDQRDGVAGYEVDTYGVAAGIDTETLAENWIWGLAFAYAETDVDSKGVNNTQTDIESYQVGLYANYDADARTYISGQLGYVWGDNDQTRSNIGGTGVGLTANADYDSSTWFARLEAGRKYATGGYTILTPKVFANYQHYEADGYTETGAAGNAGLVVSSEDLDLFEIGIGVDANWDFQNADGSYWQPKIGVGVRHDLIGDEYETTSRFIGAGGNFNTKGFDPAQTTVNIGADVTYFSTTNWELSAGYDFEVKSDYDAHSGTLRAAYKF